MTLPDEQDLLQLFKTDPQRAIKLLFDLHYTKLTRASLRIVGEENAAEDMVQEVFCELWKKRDSLEINISPGAYLRRAVVNKSLNYIKKKKILTTEEDTAQPLASSQSSAQETLEASELERVINQAIDNLPDKARVAFSLSRFEELTYPEIAEKLGISVKTVEYQVSRALSLLREAVGPYLNQIWWFLFFPFL